MKPALDFITPEWNAPKNVHAMMTLRTGGVSSGVWGGREGFGGFNVSLTVGDVGYCVNTNRHMLETFTPEPPRYLIQVHDALVVDADQVEPDTMRADGIMTMDRGVVCPIMTADCMPVLMTDSLGRCVCAVHAGWRSLSAGILEHAALAMRGRLGDGAELMAWIGPHILENEYEVGGKIIEEMHRHFTSPEEAFVPIEGKPGKYLCNLSLLGKKSLAKAGVTDVTVSPLSTYADADRFYSARRDGRCGRHVSLIWLE